MNATKNEQSIQYCFGSNSVCIFYYVVVIGIKTLTWTFLVFFFVFFYEKKSFFFFSLFFICNWYLQGDEWTHPELFRIGASSLLGDIERQLYHYCSGKYAAGHQFPMNNVTAY